MERADVVVLEIDLDERLPVVVALVHVHLVEDVAAEIELGARAELRKVGGDVAAVVLEHEAVPAARLVAVQVQAGILREVRRAQQPAVEAVRPAVQRADDVGRRLAAALQHHGLAMAADVGQQLDAAIGRAHEHAALAFLRQRVVVADFGDRQLVREVARSVLEDEFLFAAEQILVEIGGNGKLRARALQSF